MSVNDLSRKRRLILIGAPIHVASHREGALRFHNLSQFSAPHTAQAHTRFQCLPSHPGNSLAVTPELLRGVELTRSLATAMMIFFIELAAALPLPPSFADYICGGEFPRKSMVSTTAAATV